MAVCGPPCGITIAGSGPGMVDSIHATAQAHFRKAGKVHARRVAAPAHSNYISSHHSPIIILRLRGRMLSCSGKAMYWYYRYRIPAALRRAHKQRKCSRHNSNHQVSGQAGVKVARTTAVPWCQHNALKRVTCVPHSRCHALNVHLPAQKHTRQAPIECAHLCKLP